jgi:putative phage-type endonuclease
MPLINLEQGSPEWLSYRRNRVMATDTPVILGSNPWVTKLHRWEEKQGLIPPTEMNEAMREGQRKEPIARAIAIEILGMNFTPIVYESDEHNWMASSLDGISDCGEYILELKCPLKEKLFLQACEGFIPEYYRDQMQHQSATRPKVKQVFYGVYFPINTNNPFMLLLEKPDLAKQEKIVEEGLKFYNQMCNFEAPEEWVLQVKR